ncbi:MAG: sulfotransferase domain-containing protein [Phaeodactylibacter xiamenensis]|uniref:sulfotransferase domain-containing protein n=1 Tax=Phaeodactylibacter xiamenensis TaxID=1524460 RepID=UPI000907C336|nr:sulfotransferase domain-containing protein [Phaeodactylibacter xiamenensis]MCR9052528.1 sulfotransferase [bacterium]
MPTGKNKSYTSTEGSLKRKQQNIENLNPPYYQVLHGHLPYRSFLAHYHHPEAKFITFMRDPVERVLSNFRYYRKMKAARLKTGKTIRHHYDLETFIELKKRQNVMARFLDGLELTDLFFLGLQEQFGQDVRLLSNKLLWELPETAFQIKKNPTRPTDETDKAIRQRIAALNQADIQLYNRAVALKASGYWQ